jgi:hypothetical protein
VGHSQHFDFRNELKNLAGARPDIAREFQKDLRQICSPERENQRAEEVIRQQLKAVQEMQAISHSMMKKQTASPAMPASGGLERSVQ